MSTPTVPADPAVPLTRQQRSVQLAHPLVGVRAVRGLLDGAPGMLASTKLHTLAAPPSARAPFGVLVGVGQPRVWSPPLGADVLAEVEVQLTLTAANVEAVCDLTAAAVAAVTGRGQGGVWLRGAAADGTPAPLPGPGQGTWLAVIEREQTDGTGPVVASGLAQTSVRWALQLAVVEPVDTGT